MTNPPPAADAVFEAQGLTCGQLEPAIKTRIKELAPGQSNGEATNPSLHP